MPLSHRTVDLILFVISISNLVNLLIVAIMLSRPLGWKDHERKLGLDRSRGWVTAERLGGGRIGKADVSQVSCGVDEMQVS